MEVLLPRTFSCPTLTALLYIWPLMHGNYWLRFLLGECHHPAIYGLWFSAVLTRVLLILHVFRAEAEIWSLPPKQQTRSDYLDGVAADKGFEERIDMKKGSRPSRGRHLTSEPACYPSKLATIRLCGKQSISCGAFSRDGTKVALSTVLLTRVFLLEGSAPRISPRRIQALSKSANSAAHCLVFSR